MAIKLASAIGQQRNQNPLQGLGDAVTRQAGGVVDAIEKANARKAAEQKQRDLAYEEALKVVQTDIDALPEDTETYRKNAAKHITDIKSLYLNKAPVSDIMLKQQEAFNDLASQKRRFEEDKKGVLKMAELRKNNEYSKDFSVADEFANATSYKTESTPMQNDNFFESSEKDRAGKMVGDGGMVATEKAVVDVPMKPYFKMTAKEREQYAPEGFYTESIKRVSDITGKFSDASTAYFGKDWNPEKQYVNLVTTENKGGLDKQEVVVDENKIARDKTAFLSSFGTDLGGKDNVLYWKTLTRKAEKAGRESGKFGEDLEMFVKDAVLKTAANDFDNRVRQDIEKVKVNKIDLDPDKEGKGIQMNFTSGGGASKGSVSIEPVKDFTPQEKEGFKRGEAQSADLRKTIKSAEAIIEKYKSNPSSPAYQNAQKALSEAQNAITEIEEVNAKRKKGFLLFSNKKSVDDAFIDINNDGKTKYRIVGFEPIESGGYSVLGVERKTPKYGNSIDKIKNIPLTESVYKKIINENPDAEDVMNELNVMPKAGVQGSGATKEVQKTLNGVKYSLEELKTMAKKAKKTDKEAEQLWKTMK